MVELVLKLIEKLSEHQRKIAHYRNVYADILPYFRGIYIYMNYMEILALFHFGYGAVTHPRAEQYQRIAGVNCHIRRLAAVHSYHSVIQRAVGRYSSQSHHCGHNRDIRALRKLSHKPDRAACKQTAARQYKRLFRRKNGAYRPLYRQAVAHGAGTVRAYIHRFGILKIYLRRLNVHRYIYQHGTAPPRARDIESSFEYLGGVLGALEKIAVLDKRLGGARYIRLLKHVAPKLVGIHLTGYYNHRHGIHIRRGYRRYEIKRARSRRGYRHRRLSADTRIAACGMPAVHLVPHQNVPYLRIIQFIIKRAYRRARVAENGGYTLRLKALRHCLCDCHSSHNFLLILKNFPQFKRISRTTPPACGGFR